MMTEFGFIFSVANAVMIAVGLVLGAIAMHFLSPARKQVEKLRAELESNLAEQADYKSSVNVHFRKTADLVGEMTRSYAKVYDHLAVGARTFCSDGDNNERVPFGPRPDALESPAIDATAEDDPPPAVAPDRGGDDSDAVSDSAGQDYSLEDGADLGSASATSTNDGERDSHG